MKFKDFFLFCAAMISTAAVSCVKEAVEEAGPRKAEHLQATAVWADTKTEIHNQTEVWWSVQDSITVISGEKSLGKFTSVNTEPEPSTIFVSDNTIASESLSDGDPYWAAAPHGAATVGDGSNIILKVPSSQQTRSGGYDPRSFVSIAKASSLNFAFYNVCGGMMFTVSQGGIESITLKSNNGETLAGTVKATFDESGKPVIESVVDGKTEVTAIAPDGGTFVVGTKYYMSLLPVTLSGGMTLTYSKHSEDASISTSSSIEIKRSVFGQVLDKDAELEWKTVDKEDLSASGTANCYMISKPGQYKFDATVKGCSMESVGAAVSATVLWESFGTSVKPNVGDVVKDVSFENGYVKFRTSTPLNDGNAVIAVTDISGNILWSWHIWVCDGFNAGAKAQTYNNAAGTMMDRNLGATTTAKGDVRAVGLLYQWGRKDPFLGGRKISGTTLAAASTLSWPSAESAASHLEQNNSLSYSVSHPTTYLTNDVTPYDWYCTASTYKNDKLWSSEKSIYDPCPKGWRVPDGGNDGVWATAFGTGTAWTTSGNFDTSNRGMDFATTDKTLGTGTIWYPAAGYRGRADGYLSNVGNIGRCWACITNGIYGYSLSFSNSGNITPANRNTRAYSLSVRCVRDESAKPEPQVEYVDLGLSVKWAACNIGASAPQENGRHFAWGDVAGQTWNGSGWSGGGFSAYIPYELDVNGNLTLEYDAAHVLVGGRWRMPTQAEQQELIDNCSCTWTDNYEGTGVAGIIFMSNKTGYEEKSIFFPAAGGGRENGLYCSGTCGYFWSSSFYHDYVADCLDFDSDSVNASRGDRNYGFPIRPVSK